MKRITNWLDSTDRQWCDSEIQRIKSHGGEAFVREKADNSISIILQKSGPDFVVEKWPSCFSGGYESVVGAVAK